MRPPARLWMLAAALAGLTILLPRAAGAEPRIPLVANLVLTFVGNDPVARNGQPAADFERVLSVRAVRPDGIQTEIQFDNFTNDPKLRNRKLLVQSTRSIDLSAAHKIMFRFLPGDPETFPGYVEIVGSRAMLDDLTATGKTAVVFADGPPLDESDGGLSSFFAAHSRSYFRGELDVVEPSTPVDVLVNGVKTTIPTVHAHGVLKVADNVSENDFWWSLDRDNPILVRALAKEGRGFVLVRADSPEKPAAAAVPDATTTPTPEAAPDPAAAVLRQALESDKCRAELHGVYFATDSATLLPESEPTLKLVADMIAAHPKWAITVEGHTDNVGGDAYNLDLSKRRATAVRDALSALAGPAAADLSVAGYGATRPADSNDTPVGRAHNRRVELARSCK